MLETPGHPAHSQRDRTTEIKIYAYNIEISENINKNILLTRLPFLPYNYTHCSEYDKVYVWFPYSKNISRTLSFLKLKPLVIILHFLKGRYAEPFPILLYVLWHCGHQREWHFLDSSNQHFECLLSARPHASFILRLHSSRGAHGLAAASESGQKHYRKHNRCFLSPMPWAVLLGLC